MTIRPICHAELPGTDRGGRGGKALAYRRAVVVESRYAFSRPGHSVYREMTSEFESYLIRRLQVSAVCSAAKTTQWRPVAALHTTDLTQLERLPTGPRHRDWGRSLPAKSNGSHTHFPPVERHVKKSKKLIIAFYKRSYVGPLIGASAHFKVACAPFGLTESTCLVWSQGTDLTNRELHLIEDLLVMFQCASAM